MKCLNLDIIPIVPDILLATVSIWTFQVRCLSIITPKYLILCTLSICSLLIFLLLVLKMILV